MVRTWVPTRHQRRLRRKEERYKPRLTTVPISVSDERWLDQFIRRIQFWSFGFFKVRKDTMSTKFRIYTRNKIFKKKLIPLIEAAFPDGCKVTPVIGYKYRNTFDVKLYRPMRWDQFIFKVVKALQDLL